MVSSITDGCSASALTGLSFRAGGSSSSSTSATNAASSSSSSKTSTGSSSNADLPVLHLSTDPSVAHRHALLSWDASALPLPCFTIEAICGAGVYVDGAKVEIKPVFVFVYIYRCVFYRCVFYRCVLMCE
jgi:hypothetical protein